MEAVLSPALTSVAVSEALPKMISRLSAHCVSWLSYEAYSHSMVAGGFDEMS
jgi:hypothetical protein